MPGLGGSLRLFRSAFKSGPTESGMWGDAERFGRFEGTGEVVAEFELPECDLAIGAEDYRPVEELELELTGPDGAAVELKRHVTPEYDDTQALRSLEQIASGRIHRPGLHRLRVRAPHPERVLLVMVGEALTATGELGDMAKEMIPGAKLWKRLRG